MAGPNYALKFSNFVRRCMIGFRMRGRVLVLHLRYPRMEDERPNAVEVGLTDVRAADSLLIDYDFERDGWRIQQATRFAWEPNEKPDPAWVEVAFVNAWGSRNKEEDDDEIPGAAGGPSRYESGKAPRNIGQ